MNKLSREQKKIIYITLIGFASLIVFWVFIFVPQSRKLTLIKRQLREVENQIAEIKNISANKDLGETVRLLDAEFRKAMAKLPPSEENIIGSLSELGQKNKINITSLDPLEEISMGDPIYGYNVYELPINLNLLCEFRDTGEFLEALRDNFEYLVKVKQLNIKGRGEGQKNLNVTLQVSVYLAKPK